MNENELYWAAGLWDGEGSACLSGDGKYLNLQLGMSDIEPILRFGKAVGLEKIYGPYQVKNYKPIYKWSVLGSRANEIAEILLRYISEPKRKQINLVLEKATSSFDGHRGENNSRAKLTNEQVLDIIIQKDKNSREFAEEFGVSKATIKSIRNGRTWTHITKLKTNDLPDREDTNEL